jgi:hypothetical protein
MDRFRSVQRLDIPVCQVAESGPRHISGIMSQVLAQRYSNGFSDSLAHEEKSFESAAAGMPISFGMSVAGKSKLPQISFSLEANSLMPAMTG